MSISIRLKGFLDESQIPYSVLTHTTAYTAQGAAATMQISGKELAKSVVLWAGEEMILAVLSPLLRLEDGDGTRLRRWVANSLWWVKLVIDR